MSFKNPFPSSDAYKWINPADTNVLKDQSRLDWKLINAVTLTDEDEVSDLLITTDMNGNLFAYHELWFFIYDALRKNKETEAVGRDNSYIYFNMGTARGDSRVQVTNMFHTSAAISGQAVYCLPFNTWGAHNYRISSPKFVLTQSGIGYISGYQADETWGSNSDRTGNRVYTYGDTLGKYFSLGMQLSDTTNYYMTGTFCLYGRMIK